MQIATMRMCFNTSNDMQASPIKDASPPPSPSHIPSNNYNKMMRRIEYSSFSFSLPSIRTDESVESILLVSVHRHVVGGTSWHGLLSKCQGEGVLVRVLLLTVGIVSKAHR
jgi:hypothetical protein